MNKMYNACTFAGDCGCSSVGCYVWVLCMGAMSEISVTKYLTKEDVMVMVMDGQYCILTRSSNHVCSRLIDLCIKGGWGLASYLQDPLRLGLG